MWLYACCGLLCPAYPQHFAHGSVNKIPGYPGRAGTLNRASRRCGGSLPVVVSGAIHLFKPLSPGA
ncbi:hypothetical protein E6C85_22805 [Escherichia coli]|nr:hypothetical protein [Escherichia coli]